MEYLLFVLVWILLPYLTWVLFLYCALRIWVRIFDRSESLKRLIKRQGNRQHADNMLIKLRQRCGGDITNWQNVKH